VISNKVLNTINAWFYLQPYQTREVLYRARFWVCSSLIYIWISRILTSLKSGFLLQNKKKKRKKAGDKELEYSDLSGSRRSNQAHFHSKKKKSTAEYRQNGLIHRRRYWVGFPFSPKGERLSLTPPLPFELYDCPHS
jgi:hypothetical protein